MAKVCGVLALLCCPLLANAGLSLMLPFHQGFHRLTSDAHNSTALQSARIVKSSHFEQSYKLGYKIVLLCVADGRPTPAILWYKDGYELPRTSNTHLYEYLVAKNELKSKIEIDPASIGNQGIYTCIANNLHAFDHKNFKMEYYY